MKGQLYLANEQREHALDTRLLRAITRHLLEEDASIPHYELGVRVVGERRMISLNETHLGHKGCTDVITFDYRLDGSLAGDIFVCLPEAIRQAKRFHTSWPEELVRYIVHGTLHLRGYDDHAPAERKRMKAQENRFVRHLGVRFHLSALDCGPKAKGPDRA